MNHLQKIIAKKNDSKNRKISFKTDMSPIGSITIKERNDSIWMTTGRIIQSLQVSTKT